MCIPGEGLREGRDEVAFLTWIERLRGPLGGDVQWGLIK